MGWNLRRDASFYVMKITEGIACMNRHLSDAWLTVSLLFDVHLEVQA